MRERLSGIPEFVQAVESGSFALAAERLNLTRSAVGKSIARLEQRLGARLFHRTTRQQSLTEEGQAFYNRCVRALSEIGEGEAQLTAARSELPCWMVSRYVREGQLKLLLKSDQAAAHAIYAVWPKTRYPPSKTRVAIDALVAEVPALIA